MDTLGSERIEPDEVPEAERVPLSGQKLELAIQAMESSTRDLLARLADFEREYTTKEEWVRESMLARQQLERLTEMMARIEAELEGTARA